MNLSSAGPNLFNRVFLHIVQPVTHGLRYRGLGKRMAKYRRLESLSISETQRIQWNSLSRLLTHAYESSPFYRDRFDRAGLKVADIRSTEDLKNIPPLTREEIRQHSEEMWSRHFKRESLLTAATGGTTDTPVLLLRSEECVRERMAVQTQFDSWAGLCPGDRVFRLWGAQQDFAANPSWRWRLYDRYVLRNVWAPTSLLNTKILEQYRLLLNEFQPKVIYSYPTPLALFCEYLETCGKPYHRPASVICTAEPLQDQQRSVIERSLGCSAFEHYGTRDFGMVAAECEAHQGMHFNPGAVYVEYIPMSETSTEKMYEILVTDLLNFGMPMIRYRINDCVLLPTEPCRCGRGYPLIRRLIGRTGDVFRLRNGDLIPGVALTNRVLQVCPGLLKTQIIQESLDQFRVRYVPGTTFSATDLELLRANLRRFLPDSIQWVFEQVTEIPRERSGKTRFCISRLASSA